MKVKYIELNLAWVVDTPEFWENVKREYVVNAIPYNRICYYSDEFRHAWQLGGREKIRQYAKEYISHSGLDCRVADNNGDLFLCSNESESISIRRAFIDYMVKEMAKPLNIT
jgi:hypothetical protein